MVGHVVWRCISLRVPATIGPQTLISKARFKVGLTGGIASGKSSASARFIELGVPVIDADLAARAVVEPGSQGLAQVVEHFGPWLLTADGHLDRSALRAAIFADADARTRLNAILHPLIRARMESEAAAAVGPYVVLAIPLLVESGSPRERVDRVLVIDVDEKTQIERLLAAMQLRRNRRATF